MKEVQRKKLFQFMVENKDVLDYVLESGGAAGMFLVEVCIEARKAWVKQNYNDVTVVEEAVRMIGIGQRINAVRLYREYYDISLVEAKRRVDFLT